MSTAQQPNFSTDDHNMTFRSVQGNQDEYLEIRIILKKIVPPVLILVGSLGNTLSLAAIQRSASLRNSSACLYLRAFFLACLLVLYIGNGLEWISFMFNVPHISNISDALCRIWHFFSNFIIFLPIWLCVGFVLDRYICACHPRSAESYCTLFSAKIIVIVIQLGLILVSIHAMWTFELHPRLICWVPYWRKDIHTIAWLWVSVVVYTFLPLAFLIIFCLTLSIGVCKKNCQNNDSERRQCGILTFSAFVVGMIYVLLALPATIMEFYRKNASHFDFLPLLEEIFQLCAMSNYAVMGFACFCSSSDFRDAILRLCFCKGERTGIELSLDESSSSCKYRPSNGSMPVVHNDNCQL